MRLARSGQCHRTIWSAAISVYQPGYFTDVYLTSWAVFGGKSQSGASVRAVLYYLEPFGQSVDEIRRNAYQLVWLEAGRAWIAYRSPEEGPPLNLWDPTGGGVYEIMPEAVEGVDLCTVYEQVGITFMGRAMRAR